MVWFLIKSWDLLTVKKLKAMTTNDHPIRVTEVKPNAYNSKVNQAELRMEVSKSYPSKKVGNSHQSALAPLSAFGLPESSYTQERVVWIDVPKSWGITEVEQSLKALPKARIYRVLSFEPILTDSDYSWMETLSEDERVEFLENKKEKQAVVDQASGELVTRNGKQLYRRLFFSADGRPDEDYARTNVTAVKEEAVTAAKKEKEIEDETVFEFEIPVEAERPMVF